MLFQVIVPADLLTQILLGLIYVAVLTTVVAGLNGIDSKGWDRVFSFLFSVWVAIVLLLLLSGLEIDLRGKELAGLEFWFRGLGLWVLRSLIGIP